MFSLSNLYQKWKVKGIEENFQMDSLQFEIL